MQLIAQPNPSTYVNLFWYRIFVCIGLIGDALSLLLTKFQLLEFNRIGTQLGLIEPYIPNLSPQISFSLYVLVLIGLLTGKKPQFFAGFSLLFYLILMSQFPFLHGVTYSMASYLLIPLILADSSKRNAEPIQQLSNAHLAAILVQLQICQIYLFAFIKKITSPSWYSGDAIQIIFSLDSYTTPLAYNLRSLSTLLSLGTFLGLCFLLCFPFLIWKSKYKIPLLLAGIAFHSFNAILLGIPFFSICFIAHYFLFLEQNDWAKIKNFKART